jgi:hypothetical protein
VVLQVGVGRRANHPHRKEMTVTKCFKARRPSPNIVRVIKKDELFGTRGTHGGVHRVLVGRRVGKTPLGRRRRRWEDNINIDLREIGIDGANWSQLPQDRVHWRAFVNTVMNLRVP